MTPDDAEHVHEVRRNLAALARQHGWETTLPHSGDDWVWLQLFRPTDGARLAIEWADDLPTGCQLHAVAGLTSVTRNMMGTSSIRIMIGLDPAGFRAAVDLAAHIADSPIIDLTDEAT